LISGVAHQIRNPLNAMNLQLELLSQGCRRAARRSTSRLRAVPPGNRAIGRAGRRADALHAPRTAQAWPQVQVNDI